MEGNKQKKSAKQGVFFVAAQGSRESSLMLKIPWQEILWDSAILHVHHSNCKPQKVTGEHGMINFAVSEPTVQIMFF